MPPGDKDDDDNDQGEGEDGEGSDNAEPSPTKINNFNRLESVDFFNQQSQPNEMLR